MSHKEDKGQANPAEAVRRCLNYSEQAGEKVGAVVRGCNSHAATSSENCWRIAHIVVFLQCSTASRPGLVHSVLGQSQVVRFSPPANKLMSSTEVCELSRRGSSLQAAEERVRELEDERASRYQELSRQAVQVASDRLEEAVINEQVERINAEAHEGELEEASSQLNKTPRRSVSRLSPSQSPASSVALHSVKALKVKRDM
ncbi:hypothetical protein GUITHDRAFT_132447 [Guillardia theta CCMP2712]|uniref:Uncharacterized protein n=1 Tax=Guillardia theta (strain CCMP2712) TaxID=905079 RepID=L1JZK7_GUITC|nr:hypothetical protein GUITHDRAFT_132447 [Guillardia theta CCMP2712]EKX54031.1 hypothetical protein GUITHDRAFT_132447 [Guillardia theta CCMP2712]|eukprot:XP_005841011.1 hypothetical protein GUITHDRAFT_132447 [Guillardia theta CCMP2712]